MTYAIIYTEKTSGSAWGFGGFTVVRQSFGLLRISSWNKQMQMRAGFRGTPALGVDHALDEGVQFIRS